jgi:ketosteroid isomerase-like protein
MMSAVDEVHAASQAFYAALNKMANGDATAMASVWSHTPDVTAMHPIGGRDLGWPAVRHSFEQVAAIATEGRIQLVQQTVHAFGDMGYETGTEKGEATFGGQRVEIEHRVTNVYERQGALWKMIHHHTDLSPAMIEIVKKLQAGGK